MQNASYLLLLDGSAEARAAAEFAWGLAKSTNSKVVAQSVLDIPAIIHFLSFRLPGFVGSGVYIDAQMKITAALRTAAETVALAYATQCEGHAQKVESHIDEGDTVSEINRRSADHDLVIVGQINDGPGSTQSATICTELAEKCKKPIVVVQVKSTPRSGTRLLFANQSANPELMAALMAYAKAENIPVEPYNQAEMALGVK
jgi:nucleotide-binding universal stress UspA family protein